MIVIAQCLCPSRHCMMAALSEDDPETAKRNLQTMVEKLAVEHVVNKRCGLCGSTDLRYEAAETEFATMAEAKAAAKQLEQEQMEARRILHESGLALDARRN